jgi:hypothetical protein
VKSGSSHEGGHSGVAVVFVRAHVSGNAEEQDTLSEIGQTNQRTIAGAECEWMKNATRSVEPQPLLEATEHRPESAEKKLAVRAKLLPHPPSVVNSASRHTMA